MVSIPTKSTVTRFGLLLSMIHIGYQPHEMVHWHREDFQKRCATLRALTSKTGCLAPFCKIILLMKRLAFELRQN